MNKPRPTMIYLGICGVLLGVVSMLLLASNAVNTRGPMGDLGVIGAIILFMGGGFIIVRCVPMILNAMFGDPRSVDEIVGDEGRDGPGETKEN